MKVTKFEDKKEWLDARSGKITGSSLKNVLTFRGTEKKVGYWQLIADRLATPKDGEDPMERGNRLETDAINLFTETTGFKVNTDLVIWSRDDYTNIAISPDGFIEENGKVTQAVEVKCLNSASHIEAIVTNKIPKDYYYQILQYFIVNEDLEQLHFVMYDPRFVPKLQYKAFIVDRASVELDVEKYLAEEKKILDEVNQIVSDLTY